MCDESATYRRVAQMKPTRVNSVVVQKLIQIMIEESKVKPKVVRFYRKVMKNMLTVALSAIKDGMTGMSDLKIMPSRNCHMLRLWLNYREREVYPKMEGYTAPPPRKAALQASSVSMAYEPLPEKLKFVRYAVSAIPLGTLARLKPGMLPGKLCNIPPGFGDNELVHGIIILSARAEVLCSLLKTMELSTVRMDLQTSEMVMDLGIDTTYRIEKVLPEDRDGCVQFERAKRSMNGFHFVAIHNSVTGGDKPILPVEVDNPDDFGKDSFVTGMWTLMDYSAQDE